MEPSGTDASDKRHTSASYRTARSVRFAAKSCAWKYKKYKFLPQKAAIYQM